MEMQKSKEQIADKERLIWADFCRVSAIILVVLIHSSAPIFYQYNSISTKLFLCVNLLDSFSRVAVPLFVLLSGALLLDVHKNLKLVKRVSRVAVPLIFWSTLYAFVLSYNMGEKFWPIFANIFKGPIMFHLGFVYMLLGIYLLLPFSQAIYSTLINNQTRAAYFFVLWFLANSITIYYPIPLISSLQMSGFLGYTGLFMLGAYLGQPEILKRIKLSLAMLLYILGSLSTFFLTWYFTFKNKVPTETAYQYLSPNVLISSISLFVVFQKITLPKSKYLKRSLVYLSPLVFPVYLMHPMIMNLLGSGLFFVPITPYFIYSGVGIFILAALTLIFSFALAGVSRFIPFSEKFIG